jgi:hypothetical protein
MVKERGELVSSFEKEKERLVLMYENALHEKEEVFREKIEHL